MTTTHDLLLTYAVIVDSLTLLLLFKTAVQFTWQFRAKKESFPFFTALFFYGLVLVSLWRINFDASGIALPDLVRREVIKTVVLVGLAGMEYSVWRSRRRPPEEKANGR